MRTRTSQKQTVLNHLERYGSLSSLLAFELYRITRLAAVVFDLKKAGYPIVTVNRKNTDKDGNVVRWTEYRMN